MKTTHLTVFFLALISMKSFGLDSGGLWLVLGPSNGEKFYLNIPKGNKKTVKLYREQRNFYLGRILVNPPLMAVKEDFGLALYDVDGLILSGQLSSDGTTMDGTYSNGAGFTAIRIPRRKRALWNLCSTSSVYPDPCGSEEYCCTVQLCSTPPPPLTDPVGDINFWSQRDCYDGRRELKHAR